MNFLAIMSLFAGFMVFPLGVEGRAVVAAAMFPEYSELMPSQIGRAHV